jgi:hypothetical protein
LIAIDDIDFLGLGENLPKGLQVKPAPGDLLCILIFSQDGGKSGDIPLGSVNLLGRIPLRLCDGLPRFAQGFRDLLVKGLLRLG